MKSGDSSLDTNNHNTQQQRLNQGNQNRLDGMAEQSMGGGDTDSARPLTSEQPEAGQPKIPSHNPSSTGSTNEHLQLPIQTLVNTQPPGSTIIQLSLISYWVIYDS